MIARASVLPLALLAACGGADPDGDGLINSLEADIGSDPKVVDSDGDGLDDLGEKDAGTDPTKADSDGDGASDKLEVDAGTDPLDEDGDDDGMSDGDELKYGFDPADPKSDGYKGGWPMQEVAVKDGIEDGGGKPGAQIGGGKRFRRGSFNDQFRDLVDLYDFAGQGHKVVVDASAQWCPPCQFVSEAVSGRWSKQQLVDGGIPEADANKVVAVADAVANGELYWITFMSEDNYGNAPTMDTVKAWEEAHGGRTVATLLDADKEMVDYMVSVSNGWPTVALLNESMTDVWDSRDDPTPFHYIIEVYDRTLGKDAE